MNPMERGALTTTGSTRDRNLVDGVFSHVADRVMLNVILEVDLIEGVLEFLDAYLLVGDGSLQQCPQFILLPALLVEVVESDSQSAQ